MRLLALVCPNGLGHYRRVTAILARLIARRPDLRVDLACAEWQVRRLADTLRLPAAWNAQVKPVFGLTEPGVNWADTAAAYRDGRLAGWEARLAARLDLAAYDAVWSDNLSGILAARPDAILSGSFLWSEVLDAAYPNEPVVREFGARERALLAETQPAMLCTGALATPGVLARTAAVDCGFTVYDDVAPAALRPTSGGRRRVAFLGGATGAAAAIHGKLIRGLAADARWEIALPRAESARLGLAADARVVPFDFTAESYRACAALVARPGLGTVHEALAAGVPLLCSYEGGQFEMTHIAQRVAALGLGRDFGAETEAVALGALLEEMLRPSALDDYARARAALPLDGVERAAAWFDTRLSAVAA